MKLSNKTVLSLFAVLVYTQTVHAYIDPGTGNYPIQFLIAGLATGLYSIIVFRKQIKSFYKKLLKKNK